MHGSRPLTSLIWEAGVGGAEDPTNTKMFHYRGVDGPTLYAGLVAL